MTNDLFNLVDDRRISFSELFIGNGKGEIYIRGSYFCLFVRHLKNREIVYILKFV